MTDFINLLMSGLSNGAIYAFLALAYGIIFATSGVFNTAMGPLMVLGGLVGQSLLVDLGVNWGFGLLIVAVVGAVASLVVALVTITPVKTGFGWLLTTLGAAYFLQQGYATVWGTDVLPVPSVVSSAPQRFADIRFIPSQVLAIVVVIVMGVLLEVVMRRTKYGRAWSATAQDPGSAASCGVNVNRVVLSSFAIAGLIGAIGGLMVTPVTYVDAFMGLRFGFTGFLAVAIGGMTRTTGAVAGGLILGLLESFSQRLVGANFFFVLVFVMVLGWLMIRPQGLFAEATVREV